MRNAFLLALPLTATALFAGGYTAEDRASLLARLDDSRREAVVSVESVSHKQSMWTPDSNRWTVLQVLEHLALTEDFLFGMLEKSLAEVKPLPDSEKLADPAEGDARVLRMITNRTQKAKAPEPAVPKDKFANRDAAMLAFTRSREKTANFVRTTQLDLRRYIIDTPMGKLDAHQWILMLSGHTQRHVQQIGEVLSHPQYPRETN
ncbi:MAG: DinB family protein [Acidobacteria bacterium]|nr:DinB family protein [Acidobacteriota bacterium]